MNNTTWSRILVWAGVALTAIGSLDPLEGSLLIVPGIGLAALGVYLAKGRFRRLLPWAFVLTLLGVAMLWGISSVGSFGGDTGRNMWWALILLPYPIGAIGGLVMAILWLRDASRAGRASKQH